jgi:Tfp pilus assembly protein PilF
MMPHHSHSLIVFCALVAVGTACGSLQQKKPPTDRERAGLYLNVGNAALGENDPTGALQSLFAAEKLDPTIPEIHHSKALAFFVKKDITSAIESARKAVQLDPKYSVAQNTLGKLLMDLGRNKEAIPALKVAANDPLNREAFKALTNLGILHYRTGEYTQSRTFFDRAVAAAPANACVAYYYRGHLALRRSDFKGAVSDYDSATRRFCGNFAEAHLALGVAYEQSKQFGQARRKFLDVQSRYPNTQVADSALDHLKNLP